MSFLRLALATILLCFPKRALCCHSESFWPRCVFEWEASQAWHAFWRLCSNCKLCLRLWYARCGLYEVCSRVHPCWRNVTQLMWETRWTRKSLNCATRCHPNQPKTSFSFHSLGFGQDTLNRCSLVGEVVSEYQAFAHWPSLLQALTQRGDLHFDWETVVLSCCFVCTSFGSRCSAA